MTAATTTQNIRTKSEALADWFEFVRPTRFALEVFGNLNRPFDFMLQRNPDGQKMKRAASWADVFRESRTRPDVYLPYCTFFAPGNVARFAKKMVKEVHAFCIDLDNANDDDAAYLAWAVDGIMPAPSYIVNSGGGLHVIYNLETPYPAKHRKHKAIAQVHDGLKAIYAGMPGVGWKVDPVWFGQPFRIVGGQNKYQTQARPYRTGPAYTMEHLAHILNAHRPKSARIALRWEGALLATPTTSKVTKTREKGCHPSKTRDGYYVRCLDAARHTTVPGHRYGTMRALAAIAWRSKHQSGMTRAALLADLKALQHQWNDATPRNPVRDEEAGKAARYFGHRSQRVRRDTLAQLFGFEPPEPQQRYELTRAGRDAAKREQTRQHIAQAADDLTAMDKKLTAKTIAEYLGMTPQTVGKYIRVKGGIMEWKNVS